MSIKAMMARLVALWCLFSFSYTNAAFNNVPFGEIAVVGNKALGGVAWGDFDNDLCFDALINTDEGAHLFQQHSNDVGDCGSTFQLKRTFNFPTVFLRSVIWGDINNDGLSDFAVNRHSHIAIYKNVNGTAEGFELAFEFLANNAEGMSWIDYDGDGFLDLLVEDNSVTVANTLADDGLYGLKIYQNIAGAFDASSVVSVADDTHFNGDYVTAADIDVDGDIDFYVRRNGQNSSPQEADLFINNGLGQFTPNYDVNEVAANNDKGGAAFCDLDSDGDFDLVRSNSGHLGVFEQTGVNSAQFTLNEAAVFSGQYESVACGDIDNDGDIDLFFSARLSSDHSLYLNQGSFVFIKETLDNSALGEGRGAAFADYDRDGDLDLLVNNDKAESQLWENQHNSANYLQIKLTTLGRDATGASVRLFDCDGAPVSPRQEINGGMGRGSQSAAVAHFGLQDVNKTYIAQAMYVGGIQIQRAVVPSSIEGYKTLTIDSNYSSDVSLCKTISGEDTDGDGIIDAIDIDDDNDTITDVNEGDRTRDTDGDGIADSIDLDSDNDGIYDFFEANPSEVFDQDNNGRIDSPVDVNENGLADQVELDGDPTLVDYDGDQTEDVPVDTDGDNVPDYHDLDSDNDTALDAQEKGDNSHPVDTDGDKIPDYRDLDSDNDGIPDIREVGGIKDNSVFQLSTITDDNGDGLDDDVAAQPSLVPDTDQDGTKDYLDLNSDDDPFNDVIEAGGHDDNADNVLDNIKDENNNGYDDSLELLPLPVPDNDGDGIDEYQDPYEPPVSDPDPETDPETDPEGRGGPTLPDGTAVETGLKGSGSFDVALLLILIISLACVVCRHKQLSIAYRSAFLSIVTIALLNSMLVTPALADENSDQHWYLGAGIGISELEPDPKDTGLTIDDSRDFGWKVFVGYDISESISLEAYYSDLGEMTFDQGGYIEYRDYGIGGVFYLLQDIGIDNLHIFGKAGLGRMGNSSDVRYERAHDHHLYFGPGLEYRFDNGFALRTDLDLYDKDSRFLSISLMKRFGGNKPERTASNPMSGAVVPVALADSEEIDSSNVGNQMPIVASGGGLVTDSKSSSTSSSLGLPGAGIFAAPLLLAPFAVSSVPSILPLPWPFAYSSEAQQDDALVAGGDCLVFLSNDLKDRCKLTIKGVNFEFDSDELNEGAQVVLLNLITTLKTGSGFFITASGHTDYKGERDYNMDLSERRAESVRKFLMRNGLPGQIITIEGHGFDIPIADNETEEGRAQNRRVELDIVGSPIPLQ